MYKYPFYIGMVFLYFIYIIIYTTTDNTTTMQVECKRCKTKWDYLGKYISNENASVTCPACLYKVKLYEKDVEVISC